LQEDRPPSRDIAAIVRLLSIGALEYATGVPVN
jgi:hypothetical protein